ncbi:MAG: PspC domain-containing protein [Pseudonocardiaceae bacterium]|nr:PspC domain-containing protein [Pseudonocardiaceae bacterium]
MLVTVSATQQTPGSSGTEDTLKDFWASRPRRPRRGRKIAGVATGIGNRYGIDPVIIRVAFVVATVFGGSGVLIYLLGWLLLPEEGDQASPAEALIGRGRSHLSGAFTVLLCLALIPASGWAFSGPGPFGAGFGLLLAALALFLLHRGRGHQRRPTQTVQETGMQVPLNTEATAGQASPAGVGGQESPVWDPLGAAPLSWDLPDPEPVPAEPSPPEPRRKSRIGPATLGVALLVAGTGVVLHQIGVDWFSPAHIIGAVLGVLGVGMVAGAFTGGGRGLIGLAVPLSVAGVLLTSTSVGDIRGGVGDIHERPTKAGAVRPSYERSVGTVQLDLTALPNSGALNTSVNVGTGDAKVVLPRDADVDITCVNGLGAMSCLDMTHDGFRGERTVNDDGPDGPGGQKITMKVNVGMGSLEVRRG